MQTVAEVLTAEPPAVEPLEAVVAIQGSVKGLVQAEHLLQTAMRQ